MVASRKGARPVRGDQIRKPLRVNAFEGETIQPATGGWPPGVARGPPPRRRHRGPLGGTGSDAAGVLQFVEAPLDEVAEPVELLVDGDALFPGFSHWDHRHDVAILYGFANSISVVATIRKQDAGLG